MNHTPGPWHVEPEQWTKGRREVISCKDYVVAVVLPEHYPEDDEEREVWDGHFTDQDRANAKLLAA